MNILRHLNAQTYAPEDGGGASSPAAADGGGSSSVSSGAPASDGGSPAAPSAPSPTTPASPASPSSPAASPREARPGASGEGDIFNIFEGFDGVDDGLLSVQIPVEAPPAPAQEAVVPPVEQAQPPVSQPQVQPQAAQPPAPPTDQSPSLDPADLGTLARSMQMNEAALVEALLPRFQLSAEDVKAIDEDFATAIPKLMAKTFLFSQQNMLQLMEAAIPRIVNQHAMARATKEGNEKTFYGKFPQLSPDKHAQDVMTVARIYRQQNPHATREQAMDYVGRMVMTMHGLAAQATAAPAARPAPFVPAHGGGGNVSMSKLPSQGEWDGLQQGD